jgi:DNA-binding SARP family transcriptional activator
MCCFCGGGLNVRRTLCMPRHRESQPAFRDPGREPFAGRGESDRLSRSPRGSYLRLAAHLHEIEDQAKREWESLLSPILSALRELCVACDDCCAEAERHDLARDAALSRERDLRHDILVVLEALAHAELPDRNAPKEGEHSTSRKEPGLSAGERSPGLTELQQFQAHFARELDALIIAFGGERNRRAGSPSAPAGADAVLRSRSPPETGRHLVAAYCLGRFQVYLDDQLVEEWPGHKALSVFKCLLLNRRRCMLKDVLYELFWSELDPEACRRNLHQAIYSLRHALRRQSPDIPYLLFEDDCYLLNPDLEIWVDAEEFDEHATAGEQLEASRRPDAAMAEYGLAEALYRGHLFEECLYEDWVAIERERLRSAHMHIAGRLADMFIERLDYSAAIALCQKALILDRCDESAHRRLMHCYVAQGQRHLALRQFRACAEALRADFGLEPSEETVALNDVLK